MDFSERIGLYREAGILDADGEEDIESVISMFKEKYGVELTEENAAMMIAHLAAAYGRNNTGEEIPPVAKEVLQDVQEDPCYQQVLQILDEILQVTKTPLSALEQEYMQIHVCTLLNKLDVRG